MLEVRQPTHRDIQELADRIARMFSPLKVVLFGSYAYGVPTPDSDVDLLVIMATRQRSVDQAAIIRQAMDAPFAVDLLVRTPEQVDERLRLGEFMLAEILGRGRILYEADHD